MLSLEKMYKDKRGLILRGGLAIAADVLFAVLLLIGLASGDMATVATCGKILAISIIFTVISYAFNSMKRRRIEQRELGPYGDYHSTSNQSKSVIGIENPYDTWECPKCGEKNINTKYECVSCNYKLI